MRIDSSNVRRSNSIRPSVNPLTSVTRGSRAAEQGDALAQDSLATLYHNGEGVRQDYVAAHKWWNLAASRFPRSQDRDIAAENRDIVAELMTPAQIAEAQRRAGEWRPRE